MTTVAVPQHIGALERANRIRRERASVKQALRAGETTVADALELECCETMEVGKLLEAQRSWGAHRARRVLNQVPVSEAKLVGTLTERQRGLIRELLA